MENVENQEVAEEKNEKKDLKSFFSRRRIFIIVIACFALWVVFFDQNSLLRRRELKNEQDKLKQTKQDYKKKINNTQDELNAMDNDEYIERIAREKHFMKKDNEDIYMILEK